MKNYIKYFLLITMIMSLSCNDEEFIEEVPRDFFTTDNIFSSGAQVEQLLITMYQQDRILYSNPNGNNLGTQGRLTGQIMYGAGTDVFTAPDFRQNDNFSNYGTVVTPLSVRLSNIYRELYQQISRANLVISLAEGGEVTFESEVSRNSILAQAKFFRAKAHGQAAELFGNVAIVDEPTTSARFDFVQSQRSEIYQFAIDDLLAALPGLPDAATAVPGKVVKGAAQHYLAEFYLGLGIETNDNNAFTQAINHASDVIDGGTYALMQSRFGTYASEPGRNVYWDLFRFGNQNYADGNTESIWTHQIDYGAFLAGDERSLLPYPRFFSPVWRAIPGVVGETETEGGRGVAYLRPTDLTETVIWDSSISDGDMRGDESNIRRTVFYNDDNFNGGSLVGQEVPQNELDAANEGLAGAAYYPIYEKLTTDFFIGLEDGQNRSNLFRDRYMIRLPETILLRAEAYYRMGDSQAAADDINLIRSRAECNILATAGMVDLDFILDERARELFGEENRWATLLRMGGTVAVDRIREYAWYEFTTGTLTFDFNAFPIPQSIIDRNSEVIWQQNSGWEGR